MTPRATMQHWLFTHQRFTIGSGREPQIGSLVEATMHVWFQKDPNKILATQEVDFVWILGHGCLFNK